MSEHDSVVFKTTVHDTSLDNGILFLESIVVIHLFSGIYTDFAVPYILDVGLLSQFMLIVGMCWYRVLTFQLFDIDHFFESSRFRFIILLLPL